MRTAVPSDWPTADDAASDWLASWQRAGIFRMERAFAGACCPRSLRLLLAGLFPFALCPRSVGCRALRLRGHDSAREPARRRTRYRDARATEVQVGHIITRLAASRGTSAAAVSFQQTHPLCVASTPRSAPMHAPALFPASPYLGLDLRLDTCAARSPTNARAGPLQLAKRTSSFDVEVLNATLNPKVKDFDTILMYTMQVSSGGRTFVCSKTWGDLNAFVNRIKHKCANIPKFPDLSSMTRWGALRAGAAAFAGAFNTEYARDSMQAYFRQLFADFQLVNWLPEVYSFFWVPVSPPGTLEPIAEEPAELDEADPQPQQPQADEVH